MQESNQQRDTYSQNPKAELISLLRTIQRSIYFIDEDEGTGVSYE